MLWRNPKYELPKEGEIVAVLYQHWKEHVPMSCQIMFGEVETNPYNDDCRVNSGDFTGMGSWAVYLVNADGYDQKGLAWAYPSELQIPSWVNHDPHWGPRE